MKRAMAFELNGVPVRSEPDEDSKVIGFLDLFDKVWVYGEVNGWYYVGRRLTIGYVPVKSVIEVI